MSTAAAARSNTNQAGQWASHLRQYIDRNVIHPHVAAAGNVLGARAIPCAAGPLIGVALAIADNQPRLLESAVAVLQVVRTTPNNGPARYAAWCLLDCCARLVAQRAFRDEMVRSLPSLVATCLPLSGVAEPSIIDVDDDVTVDATRVKARLERKCFRRLYMELMDGWIRKPWWQNPPSQLVEHVVLALCGINNNHNNNTNSNTGGSRSNLSFMNAQQQQQQQHNSSSVSHISAAMLSPETFVKAEPELGNTHGGVGGSASAAGMMMMMMATVKDEAGVAKSNLGNNASAASSSSSLSAETLSKVLNVIFTTKKQQEQKLKLSAAAAAAAAASSAATASMTGSGRHLQQLLEQQHQQREAASSGNNNSQKKISAAAAAASSSSSSLLSSAGDLLQEKRRLVNSTNTNIRNATVPLPAAGSSFLTSINSASNTAVRCIHCGSLFASTQAKNAHARIHFPRVEAPGPNQPGQRVALLRLPPPNVHEFISYSPDAAVTGAPAMGFATDAEHVELQRASAKMQQQQVTGGLPSSASSKQQQQTRSANANTVPKYGRFSPGGAPALFAFAAGTLTSKNRGNNVNNRNSGVENMFLLPGDMQQIGMNNNSATAAAAATTMMMTTADGVVLVKDPLTKRSCFKCTRLFVPMAHTASGAYYLVDCIEVTRPDGGKALAHRECVF